MTMPESLVRVARYALLQPSRALSGHHGISSLAVVRLFLSGFSVAPGTQES